MLKVEIVMDEEKILRENKYSLEDIYRVFDRAFLGKNLKKLSKGIYADNDSENDFANIWNIVFELREKDWFMSNVKKWLWYNSDDGNNESDFVVEDLIYELAGA